MGNVLLIFVVIDELHQQSAVLQKPAACSPTTCPPTLAGHRLVLAAEGAAYYSQPCHQGAPKNISQGFLPKCALFNTTGLRQASSAECGGEELCYLPAVLGGKTYYLVDFPCGIGAGDDASGYGFVGDKRCPGGPAPSMKCAADKHKQGQVSLHITD